MPVKDTLQEELENFLAHHAKMDGAKLLAFLIRWRGHEFHCAQLSHLVLPPENDRMELLYEQSGLSEDSDPHSEEESQSETYFRQNPANPQLTRARALDPFDVAGLVTFRTYSNPLTDRQTLREIARREKKLLRDISANIDTENARRELKALRGYRSFCLRPGNKIRQHTPEITKTYQSLRQAVKRLLDKLPANAALRRYIDSRLTTGLYFVWR